MIDAKKKDNNLNPALPFKKAGYTGNFKIFALIGPVGPVEGNKPQQERHAG